LQQQVHATTGLQYRWEVQDTSKEVHRESEVHTRWDDEKDSKEIDGNIVDGRCDGIE